MSIDHGIRARLRDAASGFLIVLVAAGLTSGILLARLQGTVASAVQEQSRELASSVGRALGRQFIRASQLGVPLNEIPAISRSLKGTLEHVPQLNRIMLTDVDGRVLGFAQRPGAEISASVSTELQTGSQRIGTLEVEAAPPVLSGSHATLLTGMLLLILPLALLGGLFTALYGARIQQHRRALLALLGQAPDDLVPPVPGPRPDPQDILGQAWDSLQAMATDVAQQRADLTHQVESLLSVDFDGRVRPRLEALDILPPGPAPSVQIVPPDRSRRLSLRLRLPLIIALGFALVIGALSGLQALREHLLRQQAANLGLEDQSALWAQFLVSQTKDISGRLHALTPRLDVSRGPSNALPGPEPSLDYLALVDPNREVYVLQGADTEADPLDAGTLDNVLSGKKARGLRNLDGNLTMLMAAQPVRLQGATWGLIGGRTLERAAQQIDPIRDDERYSVHFLNSRGHLVASTSPGQWSRLDLTLTVQDAQYRTLEDRDKILLLTATPVISISGSAGGLLVTLKDVTTLMKPSLTLGRLALLLAAGLAIMGLLLIHLIIWRSFRPLQDSLETLDELSGPQAGAARRSGVGHQDEIERLGRSIAAFRHKTLQLVRDQSQQARVRRLHETVMAGELRALAESMDSISRQEVQALIDRQHHSDDDGDGLRRLAEVMGDLRRRLVEQYQRLSDMVIELRDALITKTKLAGLQQELQIASAVQLSILPRTMPDDPRMEIDCRIFPARDVGGDFYDFYMLDEHHLGFVIADVSGKGIPAALFMAISRTLLKSTARFVRRPADCVQRVNALLAAENEQMLFVTLFYATLDLRDGRLDYVNAGHHMPWLIDAQGELSALAPTHGIAVGIEEDMPYTQKTLYLRPGDLLYLYTDGITEAFNPAGQVFGEERLAGLLRAQPANVPLDVLTDAVIADVRTFEDGTDPTDDVTSLCLRYRG
ncbi:PP2C family protein-serine/threonine phosphatase [Castellaniella denitrificans]|uniref:PP2C family protein-serine/threonine phosphatase n=1 Tax=Castellaniella denitrificans TaxID=56119 RepID=A0ABT4M183_9BURK|nr:PP2C family protein-serine/threonine phosphatase [Castellaniella denitrificans]MCZ4329072.1 PP2C family protein-serine/threonine phosphatase [Castellaniella denitrificans]